MIRMRTILVIVIICCSAILSSIAQNNAKVYRVVVFNCKIPTNSRLSEKESKVIGGAIRDNLVELTLNTNIKVLEREDLFAILKNEAEADKLWGIFDVSTAVEKGKMLRANYVILNELETSSFYKGFKIRSRLVNVETREIEAAKPIKYDSKKDFDKKINKLCKSLLSDVTNQIPKGIEIQAEPKTYSIRYFNPRSKNYEKTLRRFQPHFENLYITNEISEAVRKNVILNAFINPETKIIAVYLMSDNGLENITFNEDGFYWRFYYKPSYGNKRLKQGYMLWQGFGEMTKYNFSDHVNITARFNYGNDLDLYASVFPKLELLENLFVQLSADCRRDY